MLTKVLRVSVVILFFALIGCKKNEINSLVLEKRSELIVEKVESSLSSSAALKNKAREKYKSAMYKFKNSIRISKKVQPQILTDSDEELPPSGGIGNGGYIEYSLGSYVGDINDYVKAADGFTVFAATPTDELNAQILMQNQISEAKQYLLTNGLDFSDVYTFDDPNYIHAANVYFEAESSVQSNQNSQNQNQSSQIESDPTIGGCILEAVGIATLANLIFDKYVTKRIIIEAVAKIAGRYLGFVGAALAVAHFIDCYF